MQLEDRLVAEWHPTKNGDLMPQDVSRYSNKRVWWKCKQGHEWSANVSDRSRSKKCPYCINKILIKGYNDLMTVNPKLAKQWHPTKNGDLMPQDVPSGSSKKVWWQCSKGHEWQATIGSRNKGSGCPQCSGKTLIIGENDLATVNPKLVEEWHPTKNGDLTPQMVTKSSNRKVWWKCKEGHEWEAVIGSRNAGAGCRYCAFAARKRIHIPVVDEENSLEVEFEYIKINR